MKGGVCRIVMCPRPRAVATLLPAAFCPEHELEFTASPEGQNLTATSRTDFRDRLWKEQCALDEAKKRAQAEHDAREKLKN